MALILRWVRLAMAITIVVALVDQFVAGNDFPTFRAANFFSYFTVLSNIAAAAVLFVLAVGLTPPTPRPAVSAAGSAALAADPAARTA